MLIRMRWLKSIQINYHIKTDRLIYFIEFIGRTQDNHIVEYTKSFMDTSKIKFEYTLSKD